jgi:hypothetical protein
MNLDLLKTLRSEAKLRGRTAFVVAGVAALTIMFWVIMKDYELHPVFSMVIASVILIATIIMLAYGAFGRPRSEEEHEKAIVQIGPVGILMAKGVSSQGDLVQLIKEFSGFQTLPSPSARVVGSATSEKDYRDLKETEAEELSAEIKKGVEETILDEAQRISKDIATAGNPQISNLNIQGKIGPGSDN